MQVSENEVLRYLGYQGGAVDARILNDINCLSAELKECVNPKSVYGIWDCKVSPPFVVMNGITINSGSLAKHLEGCSQAVLMAATLGTEADALIRRYSVSDMGKAVIAQAVCAAMIEEYCGLINNEIRSNGSLYPISRYSPGYGDFPLSCQKNILKLLDCGKRIGLAMTDGYVLTPAKSITAVTGIAKEQRHAKQNCKHCGCQHCNLRRAN